jgi:hypothetical protein
MVQLARTDPETFIRLILAKEDPTGRDPMARVHVNLQKHLSEHPFALVELPRDHGKTTQVCLRAPLSVQGSVFSVQQKTWQR